MFGLIGKVVKLPSVLAVIGAALSAAVLLAFPQQAVSGAAKGLELCAGVIIPSLFPFLAVSSFSALSPSLSDVTRLFSPVMRHVFRLPAAAAPAVVFGLIGGYPVGCTTTAQLYEQGEINSEQAQRLTCFSVNAGPAFVITAVGVTMLRSVKAGIILFASCVVSSIIIGILLGFTAPKPEKKAAKEKTSTGELRALVGATEKAAQSIIKICAWTVLFSCISTVAGSMSISENVLLAFSCISEVTGGCLAATQTGNLCAVAAALGWSGLCVCCQVIESVKKTGASLGVFFAFRVAHAALAAVACGIILHFFPIEISVFSNVASVTAGSFSYSVSATVALLCLCTVFIIDLDRNKKMC